VLICPIAPIFSVANAVADAILRERALNLPLEKTSIEGAAEKMDVC